MLTLWQLGQFCVKIVGINSTWDCAIDPVHCFILLCCPSLQLFALLGVILNLTYPQRAGALLPGNFSLPGSPSDRCFISWFFIHWLALCFLLIANTDDVAFSMYKMFWNSPALSTPFSSTTQRNISRCFSSTTQLFFQTYSKS